jgi:hypothetical protein
MLPVKIQCGCGQKYSFDVEPVNGLMASTIACPVCGADGTVVANQVIAQTMAAQAPIAPAPGLKLSAVAEPAAPVAPPPALPSNAPRSIGRPGSASPKLEWYEQVWIALPFALVFVGGAIGGGCGGLAWGFNKKVFQKVENPTLKYVFTGLISGAAVVVWIIAASTIRRALWRR